MKHTKSILLLLILFIATSCQPYELVKEEYEAEYKEEEVKPRITIEDWINDKDTTVVMVYLV